MESKVVIHGATFAGLGMAYALGDRAIVVEASNLPGAEYIDAFHSGTRPYDAPVSKEVMDVRAELAERNILSEEGAIHLPAVAHVLCRRIAENRLPVLFSTRVIGVEPSPDGSGLEVTLHNASGIRSVTAKRFIDTATVPIVRRLSTGELGDCYLGACIVPDDPDAALPAIQDDRFRLERGRFRTAHLLKLKMDPNETWAGARDKMYRFWAARPEPLRPYKLATLAGRFERHIAVSAGPHVIDPLRMWVPSVAYGHPLAAMDAGLQFGESEVEGYGVSLSAER